MADQLSVISFILFILAGVFAVTAIALWFVFKIPQVVGDLSGRTAKKSIAKTRITNENSGVKTYRSSKTNMQRGKLTETIKTNRMKTEHMSTSTSGLRTKQMKMNSKLSNDNVKNVKDSNECETGLLSENKIPAYVAEDTGLLEDDATGILIEEDNATGLLENDATGLLNHDYCDDSDDDKETAPLNKPQPIEKVHKSDQIKLIMIDDIVMVHTDEAI